MVPPVMEMGRKRGIEAESRGEVGSSLLRFAAVFVRVTGASSADIVRGHVMSLGLCSQDRLYCRPMSIEYRPITCAAVYASAATAWNKAPMGVLSRILSMEGTPSAGFFLQVQSILLVSTKGTTQW